MTDRELWEALQKLKADPRCPIGPAPPYMWDHIWARYEEVLEEGMEGE